MAETKPTNLDLFGGCPKTLEESGQELAARVW